MTRRRWLLTLGSMLCLLGALVGPALSRVPATAAPRPFAPIKIVRLARSETVRGVAVAGETYCNSSDRVVPVFVSLSWQDQLTTTAYAWVAGFRLPGCHQIYVRAMQGAGNLVVTETPVKPDGSLGVPVTRAASN